LAVNGTAALPYHIGPAEADAISVGNLSSEPILHIVAQRRVRCQLARLWAPGRSIGMPLRCTRLIIKAAASVAALRFSSREIVLGERPTLRAMALIPVPLATSIAMSSRSRKVR